MKACTYLRDGRERLGFVVGDDVVDAPEQFADLRAFIQAGQEGLRLAQSHVRSAARRHWARRSTRNAR